MTTGVDDVTIIIDEDRTRLSRYLSGMLLLLELAYPLLFSIRQASSAIELAGFPEFLDVYTP